MKEQWEIHYSRFFNFPGLPSTCLSLKPLPSRKLRSIGNWVSSPSLASLQLITNPYAHGTVLVVSFQGKIHEEHYASKLHFTWPQVSCPAECPVRGSKVVFASYKDREGQASFCLYSLRESLKDARNVWLPSSNRGLATSLTSESVDLNGFTSRPAVELCHVNPIGNHEPLQQPPSNDKGLKCPCPKESIFSPNPGAKDANFPSSFTALLSDSCIETEQDMLTKMEMAIDDLGGDLAP
ncbi:hypothetical protein QUC31_007059 [Theobroma cacao]|uniref:Poor homologous synapsis 1 PH domain-containing protein n=1 Tax=Theobroma cacao TaxID=3641 RepID=A0A061FTU9_THECC|nr:Uncharacterized protein TCM_012189 [Theobroma cacao]